MKSNERKEGNRNPDRKKTGTDLLRRRENLSTTRHNESGQPENTTNGLPRFSKLVRRLRSGN